MTPAAPTTTSTLPSPDGEAGTARQLGVTVSTSHQGRYRSAAMGEPGTYVFLVDRLGGAEVQREVLLTNEPRAGQVLDIAGLGRVIVETVSLVPSPGRIVGTVLGRFADG